MDNSYDIIIAITARLYKNNIGDYIMTSNGNQKLKLLYIYQFLCATSSKDNALTTNRIIELLASKQITAERKSVGNDIRILKEFGVPVRNNKRKGYYIEDNGINKTEHLVIIEAIRAMQFISEKTTEQLVERFKNSALVMGYSLDRPSNLSKKYIKTDNDDSLSTLGLIYDAIDNKKKISYQYGDNDYSKQVVLRHNGEVYTASPYDILIHNNRCYMYCYLDKHKCSCYIRVDKMYNAKILDDLAEEYVEFISNMGEDMPSHGLTVFSGPPQNVSLSLDEKLIPKLYDKFGADIVITPDPNKAGWYKTIVRTVVSPDFLSWVIKFFGDVRISAPKELVSELQDKLALLITNSDDE